MELDNQSDYLMQEGTLAHMVPGYNDVNTKKATAQLCHLQIKPIFNQNAHTAFSS